MEKHISAPISDEDAQASEPEIMYIYHRHDLHRKGCGTLRMDEALNNSRAVRST